MCLWIGQWSVSESKLWESIKTLVGLLTERRIPVEENT